jgi:host factor-I protein
LHALCQEGWLAQAACAVKFLPAYPVIAVEQHRNSRNSTKKSPEEEFLVNRKLIRPSLAEIKDKMTVRTQRKKTAPQEQTNAESFYYLKQMQNRTPMVVVFQDGQELRGIIEWYDKSCIKVNRDAEPNLLVFKHAIRYMYKENEDKSVDE